MLDILRGLRYGPGNLELFQPRGLNAGPRTPVAKK